MYICTVFILYHINVKLKNYEFKKVSVKVISVAKQYVEFCIHIDI